MIEVIIATYNRLVKAVELAEKLINSSSLIKRVLIIDSTLPKNKIIPTSKSIEIIACTHQNQPYQRYVGNLAAIAPYLLFLDDDMELIDQQVFIDIERIFSNQKFVAINLPFENKNAFLAGQPKGIIAHDHSIKKFIGLLTGYPLAKPNQYIHNGIRGNRQSETPINFLSGGAFAVRREAMYKNFNMQLFSLYETKKGKGEDGILGYTLSKQGQIYAYPDKCFVHNDFNDSSYSTSHQAFAEKVMFSRLYLSCEYYRLNHKSFVLGYLRFWHFAIGRIIGSAINYMIKPTHQKSDLLKGYLRGFIESFQFQFDKHLSPNAYWQSEAKKDLAI